MAIDVELSAGCGGSQTALSNLADLFQYWVDHDVAQREHEGLETTPNTYVIVVPPHWPTHLTIRTWVAVLRQAATALTPPAADAGGDAVRVPEELVRQLAKSSAAAAPGLLRRQSLGGISTLLTGSALKIDGNNLSYGYRDEEFCIAKPFTYDEVTRSDYVVFNHTEAEFIFDLWNAYRSGAIPAALAFATSPRPASPVESEGVGQAVSAFAEAILHGDDEHRAWLAEAAAAFNAGKPMPPPRGKGTQISSPPPHDPCAGSVEAGWQPIEAAPKDGSVVDGCCLEAQTPRASITWWHEDRWLTVGKPEKFVDPFPHRWWPTHWRPRPATPANPADLPSSNGEEARRP